MKKIVHYDKTQPIHRFGNRVMLVAVDHPEFAPGKVVLTSNIIAENDDVFETENSEYHPA